MVLVALVLQAPLHGDEPLRVSTERQQLVIIHGSQAVAKYVFRDEQVLRPYFTALHAPSSAEVTRRRPGTRLDSNVRVPGARPREGTDATDHATMHPGVWLAFGDLGGADFWRNKGRVEHAEFIAAPEVGDGVVRFGVVNRYLDQKRLVCQEKARYTLRALQEGYLLTWDSTFSGSEPFAFGDQEEMGLGIRLATPLCVKGGTGAITNSDGKQNESQVWGTQAKWCDYGGTIDGQRVGILLIPHPENFRQSWFHARDYGLLVANPFGRRAFTRGEASRIEVKPGESLRLRFAVWTYSIPRSAPPEFEKVAREYVRLSGH